LLYDLQKDDKKRNDNLAEDWAQAQQYPTDYGWIGGQLEDLQGRFNLNALASSGGGGSGGAGTPTPQNSPARAQFVRLLLALNLEEPLGLDQAQALTEAITDWIDGDSDISGLSGAESEYYETADPPGRPANHAMAGPSELMMVRGMTPEIYRALAPLVTVWPDAATGNGSKININTAPVEVLRSLGGEGNQPQDFQPLTETEVETLLEARKPPKYIEDMAEVEKLLDPTGARKFRINEWDVVSDYFMLNTVTDFQGHRYAMRSILHRTSDNKRKVDTIARTLGDW